MPKSVHSFMYVFKFFLKFKPLEHIGMRVPPFGFGVSHPSHLLLRSAWGVPS